MSHRVYVPVVVNSCDDASFILALLAMVSVALLSMSFVVGYVVQSERGEHPQETYRFMPWHVVLPTYFLGRAVAWAMFGQWRHD